LGEPFLYSKNLVSQKQLYSKVST